MAKIDTTRSGAASLIYSTYLGGEVSDFGIGIALGPSNVAYATGATSSLLFPTTTGAFQTTGHANGDAFVSLVDTGKAGAASLPYSTFLGGASGNLGNAIRADATGNAYVGGTTTSTDFPVTPGAFEPVLPAPRGAVLSPRLVPAATVRQTWYIPRFLAETEQARNRYWRLPSTRRILPMPTLQAKLSPPQPVSRFSLQQHFRRL